VIDAGRALGCSKLVILYKIELPLALKTILAGVNQTLMLSLSMAVIAALIGAGGLGLTVYVGLGRLDIGQAFVGGLGIVLIAIIFDRITQKIIS
jgi:glycine betaine/proline transport system permease protein